MVSNGTRTCNEFDCPLFTLSTIFQCNPSDSISHSVSMLHECTASCTFKRGVTETIERENVQSSKLVFEHDFSNNLYSFNIYCMHSSDLC